MKGLEKIGYPSQNNSDAVYAMLAVGLASLLPDKDEIGKIIFEGHFYHAVNGDSYSGSKTNTALTNCRSHYSQAVSYAKKGNMDLAYEQSGRSLHYLQDAGEPHHASNITNANIFSR